MLVSLFDTEVPLDVEQDVGAAALHRLEVRLLHAAVVEVEPGLRGIEIVYQPSVCCVALTWLFVAKAV